MKLGGILFGTAVAFLVIVGIFMAIGILSQTQISDTYSNAPSSSVNTSIGLVTNVTAVGGAASEGMILIFAAILVISVLAVLLVYGKYK